MKRIFIFLLVLIPLVAQAKANNDSTQVDKPKIVTGFSGGMTIHGGYGFSSNPQELFRNSEIGSPDFIKNLPKDGVMLGLGGQLRMHFLNHMHLGAEGYMSFMPLMKSGSNIRFAWGGAFLDGYFTVGRFRPMLGLGLGGGAIRRLFVPEEAEVVYSSETKYNSSYTQTPFFYLNPYIGFEVLLGPTKARSFYTRIDYMLPFGTNGSSLGKKFSGEEQFWSNFITPSGPRLHIGIMFGKQKSK